MSGEALKIGSMQSASLTDSLRQVAGQFANEKAFPVLAAGFPARKRARLPPSRRSCLSEAAIFLE
jgi:hypothetical protein